MMVLTNMVRRVFAAFGRENSDTETRHDGVLALQKCSKRMREEVSDRATNRLESQIVVAEYASELDLWRQWQAFDVPPSKNCLTIALFLDNSLHSSLRDLIRRRHRASRLIIFPQPDAWPGVDSFGDLALAAHDLGWDHIELCRAVETKQDLLLSVSRDERLLIFEPVRLSDRRFM